MLENKDISDVIDGESEVCKTSGAVKVNVKAVEMTLSEIENGLVSSENIISDNNYSSGAAGTAEGYLFKLHKEKITASWEAAKDERGRGRPRKGSESAVKAFYTKAKELTGLCETSVKNRMTLYDKVVEPSDAKPIRDEIEKIKYECQKVDRAFVDKIAGLLAAKYGKSPKLTELYEKHGMKVKPKMEKGTGDGPSKNKLEVVRDRVKSVKDIIENLFKDETDDALGVVKMHIEPLVKYLETFPEKSGDAPALAGTDEQKDEKMKKSELKEVVSS